MVWISQLGYDDVRRCLIDTDEYFLRPVNYIDGEEFRNHVPAWSLSRLWDMLPNIIGSRRKIMTSRSVFYVDEAFRADGYSFNKSFDIYNNLIDCVEFLISINSLAKDYLKQHG